MKKRSKCGRRLDVVDVSKNQIDRRIRRIFSCLPRGHLKDAKSMTVKRPASFDMGRWRFVRYAFPCYLQPTLDGGSLIGLKVWLIGLECSCYHFKLFFRHHLFVYLFLDNNHVFAGLSVLNNISLSVCLSVCLPWYLYLSPFLSLSVILSLFLCLSHQPFPLFIFFHFPRMIQQIQGSF